MSGCCSAMSRSTSAVRARTELIFQEAILSVDTAADVTTLAKLCERADRPVKKALAPGAWSEGRPSVCHARDPKHPGNRGKPQVITGPSLFLGLFPCRADEQVAK
jgi:hypothetical protein